MRIVRAGHLLDTYASVSCSLFFFIILQDLETALKTCSPICAQVEGHE